MIIIRGRKTGEGLKYTITDAAKGCSNPNRDLDVADHLAQAQSIRRFSSCYDNTTDLDPVALPSEHDGLPKSHSFQEVHQF